MLERHLGVISTVVQVEGTDIKETNGKIPRQRA
jgi:hypothetical protein